VYDLNAVYAYCSEKYLPHTPSRRIENIIVLLYFVDVTRSCCALSLCVF